MTEMVRALLEALTSEAVNAPHPGDTILTPASTGIQYSLEACSQEHTFGNLVTIVCLDKI